MKRTHRVVYNPIGGSGPLAIYWHPGPYGDAREASSGEGVYWRAPNGDLLGVQFDDVQSEHDHQEMHIDKYVSVGVTTKNGKVSIEVKNKAA